jgi:8-oxo-dGTP pyrophosphatase MutT (NUDIX family)
VTRPAIDYDLVSIEAGSRVPHRSVRQGLRSRTDGCKPMRLDMERVRSAFSAQMLASRETDPFHEAPEGRHAVVAAILREAAIGVEVLLIRRAEHELDPWSGHMALPGGHGDPGDASLVATAVREVSEEVGLDLLSHAELLGRLPAVHAHPANFSIFPLVFGLSAGPEAEPNPAEVQEVVWVSLDHLRSSSARTSHELGVEQQRRRFPAFDVSGRTVWGLTYRILGDLLQQLDSASVPPPP